MANLNTMRDAYIEEGVGHNEATARTAQDAILDLIAKSNLSEHITIKGGVLMQHISQDLRRATTDFDLDFVRYSIEDASIERFVHALNRGDSGFSARITGPIEELSHRDYRGKRIHILISDAEGTIFSTKMDIGVHTLLPLEQERSCFDLAKMGGVVTLLRNSDEQVVAEKLKSLLRIGAASTRYKDVFDIYYLLAVKGVREQEMRQAIQALIFDDSSMRENSVADIARRLSQVLNDRRFRPHLSRAKNNWLHVSASTVVDSVLACFSSPLE